MNKLSGRVLPAIWEIESPFSLIGSLRPVFDPLYDSFYISDGWGTPFPSIRLRRISLSDGNETASVRVRDGARCLCFSPDDKSIIVAVGKRIIELDRRNLDVVNKWSDKVPHYCHYANMSARILLLMRWRGPSLNLYDLNNSTCRRKRVGSCQGLFKLNNNEFLVCDGKEGIIWHYSLEESKLSKLIETPQFIRARYLSKSLQLAISLGNPYDLTENEVVMHSDSRRLRIYDLVDLSYREYPILPSFNLFEANVEGTIFLSRKAWVSRKIQVETYALEGGEFRRLNSGGLARGFEILSIIPERSMVIAVSHQGRKSILAGVKLWTNATT